MTAPDQLLLQGVSFAIPPSVTRREKKQELMELWICELSVTVRSRQMSKSQTLDSKECIQYIRTKRNSKNRFIVVWI